MCKRNLQRDSSGRLLETFDSTSLRGKPSSIGILGIPTLSDAVCNFFTLRWLDKLVFGRQKT